MNGFCQALSNRRSIRRYRPDQLSDAVLEEILSAAAFCPNAGNRQTTQLVVCQDAALNDRLGRINKAAFHGRISTPTRYISKDQPSIADDPTLPSAFYGAPTVVTLFGPSDFLYTEADCWVMAYGITLAAASLGVGSCLLGRAEDTFRTPLGRRLMREWGVPQGYEARVHVTLGWPDGPAPAPKARTWPRPIYVR